jgi:hypothetical protein
MFDKILQLFKGDLIKDVGGIVDNLTTTNAEKSKLKEELTNLVLDKLNQAMAVQADVLKTELQGNWLQRSWRPLVMLTFTALIVVGAFKDIPYLESSSPYWSLLELGLGGYVIGRSVEKISDRVTQNVDLPFLKKKYRKL